MSERDKIPRWVLWLGVSVATGWLLYTLRGVLAPVFFAFLIAYMLDPLVDRIEASRLLRGKPIARAVGIAVLLVGAFALAAVAILVVVPMVYEEIASFLKRLPALVARSRAEIEPILAEYGLAADARALNRLGAELAVEAAGEASTPAKPRFVAGSMGPTTKAISVIGGITFAELVWTFREQARGLLEGGADLLFIETCQDTRNTKAALIAAEEAFEEAGIRRPVVVSGTIETSGTMLGGQAADAFLASIEHAALLAVRIGSESSDAGEVEAEVELAVVAELASLLG